ncbi:MAG: dihydroorotase [Acidobacteria bacterium]|nr:dihydroorotase [Acidobacteriota bacterium]
MYDSILIRNGTVVDPEQGLHRRANLFIRAGRVEGITMEHPTTQVVVDASDCFVCPGFVDMHVHLREPGFEHKETIATGCLAAARGGFTAVAPMPNTQPVCDSPRTLKYVLSKAHEVDLADVLPICSITVGSQGEELAPLVQLASLGCYAFSNDGQPVISAATMRRAMQAVRQIGGVIIDHCEDKALAGDGVMHAGSRARAWDLPGITPLAEEVHIARDILLAAEIGCPVHIAHLSTVRGVELVRWAKARGYPVTAEATPHHFALTVDDMPGPDPNFKMNPPLRSQADRAALLAGLQDGTIDVIATDHAPHAPSEKARGFREAPFGIIGLETAVPLIMDQLYHRGILTMDRIVTLCAVRPAAIMSAGPRTFTPGAEALVTIIDPSAVTTVQPAGFASKSVNTPFLNWTLRGTVRATVRRDKIVPYPL